MACIGFLGPDFLFGLAIGQLASARRSVKILRDSNLVPERQSWTLSHGFFADMGGFQLKAPDFPNGFPINAEQLFHLVKHGNLDFPVLTKEEICQRSRVHELSRIITIWQALRFTITEVQRVANGYPMTTLELTAISFAVVMMATSGSWYFKPSITQATYLNTKNQRTVKLIRKHARSTTLYRAASFHIDKHWSYYCELSHKFKVPLFNRRMTTTPWNRFPSDLWSPVDGWIIPFGLAVQVPFCVCFLVAWDFHFPTAHQSSFSGGFARSITPCSLSSALDTTCLVPSETLREWCPYQVLHPASAQSQHHRRPLPHNQQVSSATKRPCPPIPSDYEVELQCLRLSRINSSDSADSMIHTSRPLVQRKTGLPRSMARLERRLVGWHNISPDQDPEMEVPLRVILPILVACATYIMCRLYIYFEDFIGLRSQPFGIYMTVNKFVPFL
ncbi:hypothetical protein MCOR25_010633 [Pyricularia grisea]|nr:hypothetical protein MCOR25_010633 [Pyricularia grisea]